eukprot:SAG22_NODE_10375_length_538_cov_8.649203_1_plen_116_part_10
MVPPWSCHPVCPLAAASFTDLVSVLTPLEQECAADAELEERVYQVHAMFLGPSVFVREKIVQGSGPNSDVYRSVFERIPPPAEPQEPPAEPQEPPAEPQEPPAEPQEPPAEPQEPP